MKFFHFFLIGINYFQIQNSLDFKLPYKKHDYTKAIRYFTFFKTTLPYKNIIVDKHLLYLPPALRLSSFLYFSVVGVPLFILLLPLLLIGVGVLLPLRSFSFTIHALELSTYLHVKEKSRVE